MLQRAATEPPCQKSAKTTGRHAAATNPTQNSNQNYARKNYRQKCGLGVIVRTRTHVTTAESVGCRPSGVERHGLGYRG